MKNFAILLCLLLTLASFGLAYRYSVKSKKDQKYLVEERFLRMTAEESLVATESRVEALSAELVRAVKKADAFEKKANQVENLNADLKKQLESSGKKIQDLEKTLAAVSYAVTESR